MIGCSKNPTQINPTPLPETLHPYLQMAGPNASVAVIWNTDQPEASKVHFSPSGGHLEQVVESSELVQHHILILPILPPDGSFDYRVYSSKARSKLNTFKTLPHAETDGTSDPFSFVAYGDNRSYPSKHRNVIHQILNDEIPSIVVSTGDLVHAGQDSLSWFEEFLVPADSLFNSAPVMLSLGNHDVDMDSPYPQNLSPWWLEHFSFPGEPDDIGYGRWFSYQAGGIHFIHLDSTEPENIDQLAWIEADLSSPEALNADFRVAIFHYPPYSYGGHGSNLNVRSLWNPLLEQFGVELVFNGHNHFYQRVLPENGITYVITGGGGANLYDPGESDNVVISVKQHHFVRVEYEPGTLHCTTINIDGTIIDEFILSH